MLGNKKIEAKFKEVSHANDLISHSFSDFFVLPKKWFRYRNGATYKLYGGFFEGRIEVPTFHEPVLLKIPPGINLGSKIRLKGKGNQVITIKMAIPNPLLVNL